MLQLTEMAKEAAARTVGKVTSALHSATLGAGEEVFHVTCHEQGRARRSPGVLRKVVVTVNPNGRKATVEWPNGSTGRMNYKVCDLRSVAVTSEAKAIGA